MTVLPTQTAEPPPAGARHPRRLMRAIAQNPTALIGTLIVGALLLVALLAPLIAPYDAETMGVGPRLKPPSWSHPCGTDEFGRDLMSRLILGSRLTVGIGLFVVCVASFLGMSIGLTAAYAGGWTERILMRLVDMVFSFTETLIALAAVAVLGPSLLNAMVAVGVAAIPFYARSCFAATSVECGKPYLEALVASGAGPFRIVFLHLLPNVLPVMIVIATLGLSAAVLATAALSFLGLGAQPPTPEWGSMLASARDYFGRAPWLLACPALAICLSVLGFNLLGDGLRSALDPHRTRS